MLYWLLSGPHSDGTPFSLNRSTTGPTIFEEPNHQFQQERRLTESWWRWVSRPTLGQSWNLWNFVLTIQRPSPLSIFDRNLIFGSFNFIAACGLPARRRLRRHENLHSLTFLFPWSFHPGHRPYKSMLFPRICEKSQGNLWDASVSLSVPSSEKT